jgi:hypothetical protein
MVGKERRVAMATMAKLYAAVSRSVRGQERYREIIGLLDATDAAVSLQLKRGDIDAVFMSFCRVLLASIDMATIKKGPWRSTESVIQEMRGSFDAASMPPPQTMYLSLGFAKGVDVQAAINDDRAAARLVAYALFHELGAPEPTLHVLQEDERLALVVYADCIDGAWTIFGTPLSLEQDGLTLAPVKLTLSKHRPGNPTAMKIHRVSSERVSDAGLSRTMVALALLGEHMPIAVPDRVSIASSGARSPVLREYENAQLELYRRVAKNAPRRYTRYGRTLLSILRTWSVVDDTVLIDGALMDVIHKDGVALTSKELRELVDAALSVFHEFEHGQVAADAIAVTCDGNANLLLTMKGYSAADHAKLINKELVPNKAGPDSPLIFARPAVELAALMGAKPSSSAQNTETGPYFARFAEVRMWDHDPATEGEVFNDQSKLAIYWALVYRLLVLQTKKAHACLARYIEWYTAAFHVSSPVKIAWSPPSKHGRQRVATVPLMSYVRAQPTLVRDLLGKRRVVARVFQRTSRDAFAVGSFVIGKPSIAWDDTIVPLRSVSEKAYKGLYGPFFSKAELTRMEVVPAQLDPLNGKTDRFRVTCAVRNVDRRRRKPDRDPSWTELAGATGATGAITSLAAAGVAVAAIASVANPAFAAGLATAAGFSSTAAASVAVGGAVGAGIVGASKLASSATKLDLGQIWNSFKERKKRERDIRDGGLDVEQSAGTPVHEELFDLRDFHSDPSVAMCQTALQNAYAAAGLLSAQTN